MKLDRLLSIVILLLNRERVTAQSLAERFEVTTRTIYRDLDAINASGIPIVSTTGPGGGYGVDPDYTIDRSFMDVDDLRSLLSTLKGVNSALGDSALGSALEKLNSLAPKDRLSEIREERVVIELFPWGRREEERRLVKIVGAAIAGRRLLKFGYASYGRDEEQRTVEPMTLVFKAYAWYVWGYCRLRDDYRLFKLSRIRGLESGPYRFRRRERAYPGGEMGVSPPMVRLRLLFSAERAGKAFEWFGDEDIRRLDDGRVQVEAEMPEGEWLAEMLLGFGAGLEILEPSALRRGLAEAAGKIAADNGEKK